MLSDKNPDSCVNNEEANKKNKGWAETAANKRVKQQSQNALNNNKMSIPSKTLEDDVLTWKKINASIFSKSCAFSQVFSKTSGFFSNLFSKSNFP